MTPLRLALLRADDHHHRYLESLLSSRFDLAAVVVEPYREKVAGLLRRGRYRDWAYHLYHRVRRALTGESRYRRRYFAHGSELRSTPGSRRVEVRSINDDEVVETLRTAAADVVVVIGCSLLSPATLAAAGPLVVNVHGGFLPYYRGSHGSFFAAYDGRLDRIGSTIHRVDPGVTTGELIEVVRPPVRGDEPPEHLHCRSDLLAIHRLAGWLEVLERGGELPSYPQPSVGQTYRTRDRGPTHDLRYLVRRGARALGLTHRYAAVPPRSGDPTVVRRGNLR